MNETDLFAWSVNPANPNNHDIYYSTSQPSQPTIPQTPKEVDYGLLGSCLACFLIIVVGVTIASNLKFRG